MSNLIDFTTYANRKAPVGAAASPVEPVSVHERPAQTAAKIRAALKAAFKADYPKTKFSVTTDVYSMGSSVDVHWTDGPALAAVEAVTQAFDSRKEGQDRGYMQDGVRYYGAHYLFVNHHYSDARKAELVVTLQMNGAAPHDNWGYAPYQYERAEALEQQLKAELASLGDLSELA